MKRLLKVFFIPYYLFFFIFSCNDTKNTKYRNKFDNEFSPEKLQNNITPQSDIGRLSRRQRINKNKILQETINERIKNHIEILKNVENSKNIDDFVKNINYLNESLYTLGTYEQENIIEKLRNIIGLNYVNDRDGSVSFFLTKNIKIHQVGNNIDNFFNYCRLIISLR